MKGSSVSGRVNGQGARRGRSQKEDDGQSRRGRRFFEGILMFAKNFSFSFSDSVNLF